MTLHFYARVSCDDPNKDCLPELGEQIEDITDGIHLDDDCRIVAEMRKKVKGVNPFFDFLSTCHQGDKIRVKNVIVITRDVAEFVAIYKRLIASRIKLEITDMN